MSSAQEQRACHVIRVQQLISCFVPGKISSIVLLELTEFHQFGSVEVTGKKPEGD